MRTMTVEVVCCRSPASSKILVIDKFVLPAQILEIVQVVDAAVDDGDADAVSVQAVYVPSYGSAHCGSYIVQRSIHRAVRTNVGNVRIIRQAFERFQGHGIMGALDYVEFRLWHAALRLYFRVLGVRGRLLELNDDINDWAFRGALHSVKIFGQ